MGKQSIPHAIQLVQHVIKEQKITDADITKMLPRIALQMDKASDEPLSEEALLEVIDKGKDHLNSLYQDFKAAAGKPVAKNFSYEQIAGILKARRDIILEDVERGSLKELKKAQRRWGHKIFDKRFVGDLLGASVRESALGLARDFTAYFHVMETLGLHPIETADATHFFYFKVLKSKDKRHDFLRSAKRYYNVDDTAENSTHYIDLCQALVEKAMINHEDGHALNELLKQTDMLYFDNVLNAFDIGVRRYEEEHGASQQEARAAMKEKYTLVAMNMFETVFGDKESVATVVDRNGIPSFIAYLNFLVGTDMYDMPRTVFEVLDMQVYWPKTERYYAYSDWIIGDSLLILRLATIGQSSDKRFNLDVLSQIVEKYPAAATAFLDKLTRPDLSNKGLALTTNSFWSQDVDPLIVKIIQNAEEEALNFFLDDEGSIKPGFFKTSAQFKALLDRGFDVSGAINRELIVEALLINPTEAVALSKLIESSDMVMIACFKDLCSLSNNPKQIARAYGAIMGSDLISQQDRSAIIDLYKNALDAFAHNEADHDDLSDETFNRTIDKASKFTEGARDVSEWLKVTGEAPPIGLENASPYLFKPDVFRAVKTLFQKDANFESEELLNQYAFERSAFFDGEDNMLDYFDRHGIPTTVPLTQITGPITMPQTRYLHDGSDKIDFKAWRDAVIQNGPKFAALTKYMDRLARPARNEKGTRWSYEATLDALAPVAFYNSDKNPELARYFIEYDLCPDEDNFEILCDLVDRVQKKETIDLMPNIVIEGKEFNMPGARFYKLERGDLRALFFGNLTDNCQTVASNGAHTAIHSFASNLGACYVVEKEGEILGGSWAWISDENSLIFDSLETKGSRISRQQWTKILDAFSNKIDAEHNDIFAKNIQPEDRIYWCSTIDPDDDAISWLSTTPFDMSVFEVNKIYVGQSGSTPPLSFAKTEENLMGIDTHAYDSKKQYRVWVRPNNRDRRLSSKAEHARW